MSEHQTYYSQQGAANYLGVTPRTVRTYIASGRLPAFRVRGSRTIRIRASDLDGLLEQVPTTGAVASV